MLEQQLRLAIYDSDDSDLKSANRICILFTLHMTMPYIIICIFALFLVRVAIGVLIDVIQSWIMTLTFLVASVTTE